MALVDLGLLLVMSASVLIGGWRGLLFEAVSLMGWVAAFVVAQHAALPIGQALPLEGWGEPLRYAVGFALAFVAVALAAGWLAWLLRRGAMALGLRPADRALGALFGALRGVVLLLGLTLLVWQTPWAQSTPWRASVGVRWLEQGLQALRPYVPPPAAVYFP
ncbi:Colicin V production protein [Tepidimonas alkaliphilus]|uniref:Colicin V production protein n=1 Tax=Tepidimonas alkaliphilus TaxID=2588942 RepID=A0A554WCY4_9BURK|nr:CvpA family protein [Tepidimonas alkaliphilus]TSE21442.1 Colicin V production protein [Tepidimonas alkaliphilus]